MRGEKTIKEEIVAVSKIMIQEKIVKIILEKVNFPKGDAPSFMEIIAKARGYDYQKLLQHKEKIIKKEKKTGTQVLDIVHQLGKDMMMVFYNENFDKSKIPMICQAFFGEKVEALEAVMVYIADSIVPDLKDELKRQSICNDKEYKKGL